MSSRSSVRSASPPTRSYLPAEERKSHLLDIGVKVVRSRGWEGLSIVDLARRAGVSRQLVHQYFGDLDALAIALAERFQDEVYETAVSAIEHHPDDFAAAMRETLETFLVGLRDERLAFVDLLTAGSHTGVKGPLKQVRALKRHRLVEVWARYYERVGGLSRRDAEGLSSFQYDGLRGLVSQVDAGQLSPADAITLFIEILTGAIDRLGARPR